MKADTNDLATIFGRQVRYKIPLYQRPYVWKRNEHWEPLWQDVLWVLSRLDSGATDGKPSPHFLGAVVLEQQPTQLGDIDVRLVIDGQQRLTTLQLLLSAAARVADSRGCATEARILQKLTENDPDLRKKPEDAFKVWPTNRNRAAFVDVLTGGALENDSQNRIHEAYRYFVDAITEWAERADGDLGSNFGNLAAAIRGLMKLVVIDLDAEDDAQVIFESLNARGTRLLAIDLVKNLVFQRAERELDPPELDRLNDDYWAPFDDERYWRQEIVQGRLRRARAELFLMHWLTMKLAEEIHADHLFSSFKKTLAAEASRPVANILSEFASDRDTYKAFFGQPKGSVARAFFDRLEKLDTTTAHPVALILFRSELPQDHRDAALLAMESWLVRRMLCRLTAQGYNRLFVDLVKLLNEGGAAPDEIVYEFLRASDADSARWPTDEEVGAVVREAPLYRTIVRKRLVMVLAAVENHMRREKGQEIDVPTSLWVEHVLPQKWREHWPLADGDVAGERRRDAYVHRLGNLTLVAKKLNASMSNAAWRTKKTALNSHDVLLLNSRLMGEHPDLWDERAIDARAEDLLNRVLNIWPGPPEPLGFWRARAADAAAEVAA